MRREPGIPLPGTFSLAAALLACTACILGPQAHAQSSAAPPQQHAQNQGENGEGTGTKGAVVGTLTYNSDALARVGGEGAGDAAYLQRIGLIGDADLERLFGWDNTSAHVSLHLINGTGLSPQTGALLTLSGLEAEPALRLFNLWIEHRFGSTVSLRAGQFTAGQEFAVSPTAGLFVNSTFGWPPSFATDLPSGGPAYPLAAPGLRLAATPDDRTTVRVAVFPGDPAGQGSGDPQRRDLHGLNGFRLKGPAFLIGEVQRSAGGDNPAWTLTLGGWHHFGTFDDLARDDAGVSLASAASSGEPFGHPGNAAIYAMADARLWHAGARSVHGFARVSASRADRNPIDLYIDTGFTLAAPLPGRPNDTVGLGFAYARISSRLRELRQAQAALAGAAPAISPFEGVIEASWQWMIHSNFYLQPNVQLILHPSAALLSGPISAPLPPRAIVVGLRTSLRL